MKGGMLMQFKSVCLALSFGEVTPTRAEESCAAEYYATAGGTVPATDFHVHKSDDLARR
jgi:hypothetical protein